MFPTFNLEPCIKETDVYLISHDYSSKSTKKGFPSWSKLKQKIKHTIKNMKKTIEAPSEMAFLFIS